MIVQNEKIKIEHTISIRGLQCKLTTIGFDITEEIERFLNKFSCPAMSSSTAVDITLEALPHLQDIPDWVLSAKRNVISRRAKQTGIIKRQKLNMTLFQDNDRLVVDLHELGVLVVNGPAGTGTGYIIAPDLMEPSLKSNFFYMGLSELMRWNGFFFTHGVALERYGKGVLITGRPNQGKTTAGLSLLRTGYGFISDDFPFLRDNGHRIEMLTFYDWVDVRKQSIGFFPELQTIDLGPRFDGARKDSFSIQDLYPDSHVDSCEVDIILFPKVVEGRNSYLEPMPKHQVLKELLPQGLQVHCQELAKREFQLYTQLAKQASCYRLYFGQNRWDLSNLVDPLIKQCMSV